MIIFRNIACQKTNRPLRLTGNPNRRKQNTRRITDVGGIERGVCAEIGWFLERLV